MKVLNCAPDDELRSRREGILKLHGCEVVSVKSATEAVLQLKQEEFDALLVCHQIERGDAAQLCEHFRTWFPKGKIVAIESPRVTGVSMCDSADYHISDNAMARLEMWKLAAMTSIAGRSSITRPVFPAKKR